MSRPEDRLQAELDACRKELRASEARFRNIIDRNADGILIVDRDGVIRFANPAAGDIFGCDAGALVDADFGLPLVAGKKAEVDLIQEPTQTRTAEMRVTRTHWDGAPCHLVSLRDITERKQAEQALEAYTADLAQSNAELQRFAFVASHHLQEPLRTVMIHLQLLERCYGDELDAKAKQSIDYTVIAASQMRELIADLLSYSQVDKSEKAFAPCDCNTQLERTLERLQGSIETSDATVSYDPLPTVVADEVQIRQLFEHLIDNAIKFRDPNRPLRIQISAQRQAFPSARGRHAQSCPPALGRAGEPIGAAPHRAAHPPGEYWQISVADNGIGIDPAYHDRIFDMFYRLHTQETYPGTGIGLALCQKIVKRHEGRIWVDSEPGEGTTVHFTLPA